MPNPPRPVPNLPRCICPFTLLYEGYGKGMAQGYILDHVPLIIIRNIMSIAPSVSHDFFHHPCPNFFDGRQQATPATNLGNLLRFGEYHPRLGGW